MSELYLALLAVFIIVMVWFHKLEMKRALDKQADDIYTFFAERETQNLVERLLNERHSQAVPDWFKDNSRTANSRLCVLRHLLEIELRALARQHDTAQGNLSDTINHLKAANVLNTDEASQLHEARKICNTATHNGSLSSDSINKILENADTLLLLLKSKIKV